MTKTSPSPLPSHRTSPAAEPPAVTVTDRRGGRVTVLPGRPLPLGATETRRGLNFAIFSNPATAMTLGLFPPGQHAPLLELPLDATVQRTAHIRPVMLGRTPPT